MVRETFVAMTVQSFMQHVAGVGWEKKNILFSSQRPEFSADQFTLFETRYTLGI